MLFYTYIWRDSSGTPYYVGKGRGKRAETVRQRSSEFNAIYALGGCTVEIVDEFVLESQAHAHEIELIEKYGRREFGGTLVNKTDGGEGISGPSAETREKIRQGQLGRVHSPERRENTAAALRGRKIPPEVVEKTAAANRGRKRSPEAIEKSANARRGRKHSVESRRKMSVSHTGYKPSPEAVEKTAAANRGRKRTDETRALISAARRLAPPSSKTPSGLKGVSYHKANDRWMAIIIDNGQRRYLGCFPTPELAAIAYDAAAIDAWGIGECYLNYG